MNLQLRVDAEYFKLILLLIPVENLIVFDSFRGFDFANHFIEYTIDYSFNTYPFYEINNDNFPSIQQQIEFFESYIQESEPNLSSDEIRERALAMTEVLYISIFFFLF